MATYIKSPNMLWRVPQGITPAILQPGHKIVESTEDVFMNPATGTVALEWDWDEDALKDLVQVVWDHEQEQWVEP